MTEDMTLQSSMVAVERRYRLKPGYLIFLFFKDTCYNDVFFFISVIANSKYHLVAALGDNRTGISRKIPSFHFYHHHWIKTIECFVFTITVRLIVSNMLAGFTMLMLPVFRLISNRPSSSPKTQRD